MNKISYLILIVILCLCMGCNKTQTLTNYMYNRIKFYQKYDNDLYKRTSIFWSIYEELQKEKYD